MELKLEDMYFLLQGICTGSWTPDGTTWQKWEQLEVVSINIFRHKWLHAHRRKTVADIWPHLLIISFFFLSAISTLWNCVSCQHSHIAHIRRGRMRKLSGSPAKEMMLLYQFFWCHSWDWSPLEAFLFFFLQYLHLIWSKLSLVSGAVEKPVTSTYHS